MRVPSNRFILKEWKRRHRTAPHLLAFAWCLYFLGAASLGNAAQISDLKAFFLPPPNQAQIAPTGSNANRVFAAIGYGSLIDAQEFKDIVPAQRESPASDDVQTRVPDPVRMDGLVIQGTLLARLILFFNQVADQSTISKSDRNDYYFQVILHCKQFALWREAVLAPPNGPLSQNVINRVRDFTYASMASWGQATDFRSGNIAVCDLYADHAVVEFGKVAWQVYHDALIEDGASAPSDWKARMRSDLSDPEKRLRWEKFVKVQSDLVSRNFVFSEREERQFAVINTALTATPAASPTPNVP